MNVDNLHAIDYYKLLGVDKNASEHAINRAFRRKARVYHPDKNSNCDELMKQLTIAKQVLNDADRRAKFDDDYTDTDAVTTVVGSLSSGKRRSEEYVSKINAWISQYQHIKLTSNITLLDEQMNKIKDKLFAVKNAINCDEGDEFGSKSKKKNNLNLTREQQTHHYCELRKLINDQNITEISDYIKNNSCHSITGSIYDQLTTTGQNIAALPGQYRAILLFLRGVHAIFESNFDQSLQYFAETILSSPHTDYFAAINQFISREHINASVEQTRLDMKLRVTFRPQTHVYIENLKSSTQLRTVTKFERAILNGVPSYFDRAMLYIDLTEACGDPSTAAMNLWLSGYYLFEAMRDTPDAQKLYAYRNAICELMVNVLVLSNRFMDPIMATHFFKHSINLIYNSNLLLSAFIDSDTYDEYACEENLITEFHTGILMFASNSIARFVEITPLLNLSLTLSADTLFVGYVTSEFCEKYLNHMINTVDKTSDFYHKYQYYLLEGSWKGWADSEKFSYYRENCMESLILKYHCTYLQIEEIVSWYAINRDSDGWIDTENLDLNLPGITFDSIDGLLIDIDNGTFALKLTVNEDGSGLFNMDDIEEILTIGITGSLFSLEEPEGSNLPVNPFQQMKYGPQSIADTNYLMTLLHADYLLKMIAMRTEVSGKWPFNFRDANEGFLSVLPDDLRRYISLDTRETLGEAHRFWIEAKELPYTTHRCEQNSQIEYEFDYCPLVVKTHLLRLNANNELIDDDDDDDDEYGSEDCASDSDDESAITNEKTKSRKLKPEKVFAKRFTECYDDIGSYFPVFLRLRELNKLSACSLILKSIYNNLEEAKRSIEIDVTKLKSFLNEKIKQSVTFPICSQSKIDQIFLEVLRDNQIYDESIVAWSERDRVKRDICAKLCASQQTLLTDIANHLCELIENEHKSEMRSYVCQWFANQHIDPLVEYMRAILTENQLKKLSKFGDKLKEQQYSVSMVSGPMDFAFDHCSWIPAAYGRGARVRVYGGVHLQPRLVSIVPQAARLLPKIAASIFRRYRSGKGFGGGSGGRSWKREKATKKEERKPEPRNERKDDKSDQKQPPKKIGIFMYPTRKDAYEASKRKSGGVEPFHDSNERPDHPSHDPKRKLFDGQKHSHFHEAEIKNGNRVRKKNGVHYCYPKDYHKNPDAVRIRRPKWDTSKRDYKERLADIIERINLDDL